jgi:hypothetical protein
VASSLRTLMNESLDFPMQGFPFPIPVTSTGASTCSASESIYMTQCKNMNIISHAPVSKNSRFQKSHQSVIENALSHLLIIHDKRFFHQTYFQNVRYKE